MNNFIKIIKSVLIISYHEIFSKIFSAQLFCIYTIFFFGYVLRYFFQSYAQFIFMNFFIICCSFSVFEPMISIICDENSEIYYKKTMTKQGLNPKNFMLSYFLSSLILTFLIALIAGLMFLNSLYIDVKVWRYYVLIGGFTLVFHALLLVFHVLLNIALMVYDKTKSDGRPIRVITFFVFYIFLFFIAFLNVKFIIYPYALPDDFLNLINYKCDPSIAINGLLLYSFLSIIILLYILNKSEVFLKKCENSLDKLSNFNKPLSSNFSHAAKWIIIMIYIFLIACIFGGHNFIPFQFKTTICDTLNIRICCLNMQTIYGAFTLFINEEMIKTSEVTVKKLMDNKYLTVHPTCSLAIYKNPFNEPLPENYMIVPVADKNAAIKKEGDLTLYPVTIYCRAHDFTLEQVLNHKISKNWKDYFKDK